MKFNGKTILKCARLAARQLKLQNERNRLKSIDDFYSNTKKSFCLSGNSMEDSMTFLSLSLVFTLKSSSLLRVIKETSKINLTTDKFRIMTFLHHLSFSIVTQFHKYRMYMTIYS